MVKDVITFKAKSPLGKYQEERHVGGEGHVPVAGQLPLGGGGVEHEHARLALHAARHARRVHAVRTRRVRARVAPETFLHVPAMFTSCLQFPYYI